MKQVWPVVFMIIGFGGAIITIFIVLQGNLSANSHTAAILVENFGIGFGSLGFGGFLTRNRRR